MAWTKRKTGGSGSPARGAGAYEEEEKVPRGHVPMLVADGDGGHGERVLVPVTLLSDPCVAELLDMAAQRYGYGQPGVLRVPCDAGHFRQVLDGAMHRCGISVA
ncbi:auxin-responsive protein SAUR71 [Zea mays]|jgi:SAUR family protein|uniref:Putative auxin-induced protein family n=1 Tax=Zea mays TaxID=4577 RepID=Q6JAC8_MAIZE|nr:auxin-responsive protein SAUR71 [Zea mays]AAT42187.1 putative auxin-induced protein family [Zea mays]ONM07644.1 Putative auxin-induced protein family [Zea mays]|eukprot:XP_008665164.1 auxin-responsive protein SAUR71 [Zea mays]